MKMPIRQVLFAFTLTIASVSVRAADYTWAITTSGTWSGTANWSPNAPAGGPTGDDNIFIPTGVTGSPTTLIAGSVSVNSINRGGTGASWIFGGGTTAGVLNANSISQSAATSTIFRNVNSGGLTVNATNVTLSAGALYFGAGSTSQQQYLDGLSVSGTTTVTSGTLMVNVNNATNSYTLGLLNVGTGNVALNQYAGGSNRLATANVSGITGAGGTIQGFWSNSGTNASNTTLIAINNSEDYTTAAVIRNSHIANGAGALSITKSGTGTQTLTGANTYTGVTTINEGAIQIGSGGSTGSIVSNVNIAGSDASLIINRTGTFAYAGTISGSGQLVKRGSGTLDLTGVSSYSGGTSIEAGVVQVYSDDNLGNTSGAITFNNGATQASVNFMQTMSSERNIVINGTQARLNTTGTTNVTTLNGQISGSGGVDKRFVGTLVLTEGNTYQGGTVITSGTLVAQNTAGSATGTGTISVTAAGNLAGNGIVAPGAGNSIAVLGAIHPGFESTDTLTFSLAGSSKLDFQAGSRLFMTIGDDSDLITFASAGDWLTGSGNLALNLALGDGFSYEDSYVIFSNVTTAGFSLAGITGYDTDGYLANFQQIGNDYVVSFDVVPEPTTWMLLGLGAAFVFWQSRRRKASR